MILRNILTNHFIKSVTAVVGGTAVAQAISIALSPVITRLYGPEAFGALGVFNALIAVIAPLVTLQYDLAIAMPADDDDAVQLGLLSLFIAAGFAGISLPILVFFREALARSLGFPDLTSYLWILVPVIFFIGIEKVLMQWLIRKRRFRSLGLIQAGQATGIGAAKIGMGMINPSGITLIILSAFGHFLMAFLFFFGAISSREANNNKLRCKKKSNRAVMAKSFGDFPAYRAPQRFLNSISRNIPILMFSSFFGPAVAGFYAIGQKVLQMPIALISISVGKVLLPRFAEAVHEGRPIRPLIRKSTIGLVLVGLFPFGAIFVLGPSLFAFVFGAEWSEAGLYARWLTPWLFFGFINVPSSQSLPFSKSQRFLLFWEIASTIVKIAIIGIGGILLKNVLVTIQMYSLFGAGMYSILIIEGYRRADLSTRIRKL